MNLHVPELLAPAGSFEVFMTAIKYGADAVYLGGKELNLRAKARGFNWEELKKAVEIAHRSKRKIYYCLNIFPKEKDIFKLKEILFKLKEVNIDAVIVSDPGTVKLIKDVLSKVPVHLSTQANTTNSLSVKFWRDLGIKRINLARELSHLEVRNIRKKVPDIELEVFVHGAMCLAYSGRCLLSEYLNQRHANLGLCTQPCRYEYRIKEIVLEEKTRKGRPLWRVVEHNGYSKILSCDDLCLVGFIRWFVKNRVDALKIEGRTKTGSYVGPVVDVYKTAINDVIDKGKFRFDLYLKEVVKSTTRDLSTGFFLHPKRIVVASFDAKKNYPILARVVKREKNDMWLVDVKHTWRSENSFEILIPGLRRKFVSNKSYRLETLDGDFIDVLHSGQRGYLRCESEHLEEEILLRRADPS